jgi:murein DD-endopeptidase MepM/ murein hydrolase activator NlpD
VSLSNLKLESDVQEWHQHPNPSDTHAVTIGWFPLQTSPQQTEFLCTQGEGGYLTHFFGGNLHALDFRCNVGTPLVAVGDGIVVSVKTNGGTVTGIAVSNLFQWNSILLQLVDEDEPSSDHHLLTSSDEVLSQHQYDIAGGPLYIEYVHIATATVQAGNRVKAGQVIGTAGSVGFSPEPHLHLAAYRTADDHADTCRVFFRSTTTENKCYLPQAGKYYNADGLVEK